MTSATLSSDLARTVDGHSVPQPGTYEIDPSHSSIDFTVRHLGLSKVRGGFGIFNGTLVIADDPAVSTVVVEIDAGSFTTGNDDRDGHVKSPDFLDVEQYPTVAFATTGLVRQGDAWSLEGELTVKDVVKPVTLSVEFEGAGADPWGGTRIAFAAEAEINRDDFGINWNQTLETGGLLVGKTVKISLDIQAVKQQEG